VSFKNLLFAGNSILVCIVSLFVRRVRKTIPKASPTRCIFPKFCIWNFYYNLPKIPILVASDKETCKLDEDLRALMISRRDWPL